MERIEILKSIGFKKVDGFKEFLNKKNTKTNKSILNRIEELEYYVMVDSSNVTVITELLITVQEIKQLENFTKKTFVKSGLLAQRSGLWFEWIGREAPKNIEKPTNTNIEKLQKHLGKLLLPR